MILQNGNITEQSPKILWQDITYICMQELTRQNGMKVAFQTGQNLHAAGQRGHAIVRSRLRFQYVGTWNRSASLAGHDQGVRSLYDAVVVRLKYWAAVACQATQGCQGFHLLCGGPCTATDHNILWRMFWCYLGNTSDFMVQHKLRSAQVALCRQLYGICMLIHTHHSTKD